MKRLVVLMILSMTASLLSADVSARDKIAGGSIDIFMGVDFNFRDIYWNNRVYDVLVNLTPGVRWKPARRWDVCAQLYVPVINQYGDYYKNVRIRVASLSRQFAVSNRWKMKVSGGIFTAESYGIDLKNMFIVNPWLAATAEIGVTGYLSMASGWDMSTMKKITFMIGPESYLSRWNTQFSLRGGRYLFGDYGAEFEAFRHFRHASVGVFASYSDICKENAGFKVVIMLPPYKRKHRKVNIRPADNFRLVYNVEAGYRGLRKYHTDAEENERTGWFDRDLIPWGADLMEADFKYEDTEKKEERK